jgi:hypothetical protein
MMPSLAASHIPSPALSSLAYNSQSGHAQPAVMSHNHEGAHGLSLHDASGTPFAYMSPEEFAQLKEDNDSFFFEDVQSWLVHFLFTTYIISDP